METTTLSLEHREITQIDEAVPTIEVLLKHEFDLARGDIMRLVLLPLSPREHYLVTKGALPCFLPESDNHVRYIHAGIHG
jgi:hypothetical protein